MNYHKRNSVIDRGEDSRLNCYLDRNYDIVFVKECPHCGSSEVLSTATGELYCEECGRDVDV